MVGIYGSLPKIGGFKGDLGAPFQEAEVDIRQVSS